MIDLTDEMIVYCLPAIQTTKDYKDPVSGKRLPLYRRLRIQKRRRQDEKEVKTFLHSIDPKVGPGWSCGGQDVHGCPAPSALKKGTNTTQSRKIKFSIDRPLGQEEGEVDQVWRYVTPREENMQQHKKMPGEDEDGNEIQFQSVADAYPQSGDRKFVPGVSSTERAEHLLEFVGLFSKRNLISGDLSFGQQKLLEFAMALMNEPKVLLLDEPTAGINPTLINGLIDRLKRANQEFGITLFVIEHNMRVVMNLAESIYCLAHGEMLAKGTPDEIKNNQNVIDAYLGAH